MYERTKIIWAATLLVVWVSVTPVVSLAEMVPDGVVEAAREGLPEFLSLVPPDELEYYGFHDQGELSRAYLGEPFLIHALSPSEIVALADGYTTEAALYRTNIWQFPVVCDGSPRTLLTVDRMAGKWEAVDLGGFSPAVEMEELAERWPVSEGYELRYLRVFQTGSQFISVTRDGRTHLVPVEWTARSLGMLEEGEIFSYQRMDMAEVVTVLAPHIREDLEAIQE